MTNKSYELYWKFVRVLSLLIPVALWFAQSETARAGILLTAKYNGHTYHLLTQANWTESQAEAAALGGTLVTINDTAENTFVLNTFGPTAAAGGGKVTLWIGLNDLENEGTFVWASGETNSYTNWSAGQPQGTASDEDFVGIFVNFGDVGRWHDVVSDNRLGDVTYGVVEIGTPGLWVPGRDLAANEKPDRPSEASATNETIPEWSYGYRSTAAGPELTHFTPQQHVNDASGLEGWIGPAQATLGVNARSTPIIFNTGSGNYHPLLPGQVYLNPGGTGEFVVARWTAPAAGDYRVLARWLDLDKHGGNGATAYVVKNGQELFKQTFQSNTTAVGRARLRSRTLSFNAGDTLDFVLGSNGDHTFDATAFNAAVRRVPKVTITAPVSDPNAENPIPASQTVHFTVDVQHSGPIADVMLLVDDIKNGPVDFTPPYSLQAHLPPGYHKVVVRATAKDGTAAESPEVAVVVAPPATAQSKTAPDQSDSVFGADASAATPVGKFFYSAKGGGAPWNDPATWGSQNAVPGRWDTALIRENHHITIESATQVRHLILHGTLTGGQAAIRPDLDIYGTLFLKGSLQSLNVYSQPPAGAFLILRNNPDLKFVHIVNQGRMLISANEFKGEGVTIENRGRFELSTMFTSQGPLVVPVAGFNQTGGLTRLGADTVLRAPPGVKLSGLFQFSPDMLISDNGAAIINQDNAGLIGTDGATLIGTDGATLIGTDGATLIGTDGATLIGPDGIPLIGTDGATFISEQGGAFHARPPSGPSNTEQAAATPGTILLSGGSITGIGELRATVTNQGGYISPGNSAGGIVVNGDYTQEAGGTLVLEIGGKTFSPFTYDVFQVAGTANLGGNLVVKTINGYTPSAGDDVRPLLYGGQTGNFASVTSNAQVNLGPKGMQVTTNGTNPPGPKALNIATRMKVEAGDNALIAGFIITGSQSKKVIIRGIGPSLPFAGVLADPTLSLDNGAITNDNWRSTQEQEISATGIPPSHNSEAAIVATLNPGAHTAILRGAGNATGIGIVEVYDLESGSPVQLANISSRGLVQAGDDVMIGGFIIGGTYPTKVIVRAIGTSLPFANKLQDPTLELVDQNGGRISNDNWRETQEAEIMATTIPPGNDSESAIVATLAPGNYTAVVRGKDDTTGIAVVEAYNLQ